MNVLIAAFLTMISRGEGLYLGQKTLIICQLETHDLKDCKFK